jgi:site-specific recombinase XerD
MAYLTALRDAGASPSTRNGRLAAINALVDRMRFLELIQWATEIPYAKVKPGRDMRGPSLAAIHKLLAYCDTSTPKGARDAAIVWLLFGLGLRR